MNALELLQENPHAAQVIKEYYVELMLNSLDDSSLPENFKDFLKEQGIDDDKVAQMMEANARNVYDVLDENGFIISITYDATFEKFSWYINGDQHKIVCSTRKDAENQAVAAAVYRLERKLNPEINEDED
jgi:predicted nuclease of predicted toxin-antitoxin system